MLKVGREPSQIVPLAAPYGPPSRSEVLQSACWTASNGSRVIVLELARARLRRTLALNLAGSPSGTPTLVSGLRLRV